MDQQNQQNQQPNQQNQQQQQNQQHQQNLQHQQNQQHHFNQQYIVTGVNPLQNQPLIAERRMINVPATRGLGITEIVIGSLMMVCGVILTFFTKRPFRNASVFGFGGIVGGIFVLISGILGLMSSRNPTSSSKNCVRMGFAIFACVDAGIQIILFSIGAALLRSDCYYYYPNRYTCRHYGMERVLSGILLFIALVEFFVALTASIYCCVFSCCKKQPHTGVVIAPYQQQQQQYIVTSSTGQTVVSGAYPLLGSYPQAVYPTVPNSTISTVPPPYYPNQVVVTQAGATPNPQNVTNVSYSNQAPPVYQEKV